MTGKSTSTGNPDGFSPSLDTKDFWSFVDRLIRNSEAVIDRPRGSRHPYYPELVYPLDYGYLSGTKTIDGGGIDVWLGSEDISRSDAIAITVDLAKRDAEIKILLGCTHAEEQIVLDFLNGASMRAILIPRRPGGIDLLMSRRSVRSFSQEAVPARVLEQVIQAAAWAPSAHNRQPWRFAVLTSPESKTKLAQEMGSEFLRDLISDGLDPSEAADRLERSQQRIVNSAAAVLLCLDMAEMDTYPDKIRQDAEILMGVQSVAMAGENMLLAAHAYGLGGVWVCAPLFAQQVVIRCLELPETWQPQGLVLLGYPTRMPAQRLRRSIQEIARYY